MTLRKHPPFDPETASKAGEVSDQDLDAVSAGVIINTPTMRPSGGGSTSGVSGSGAPTGTGGSKLLQLITSQLDGGIIADGRNDGKLTIFK